MGSTNHSSSKLFPNHIHQDRHPAAELKTVPGPNGVRNIFRLLGILLFIPILFTNCDWIFPPEEFEYTKFGEAFYQLHLNPGGFEAYASSNKLAQDKNFFACLDIHRNRQANEAAAKIQACKDECPDDAVCNFDCNNRLGAEYHEGWRDLMGLLESVLQGDASYALLASQAAGISSLICYVLNIGRELQGLALLSCESIWASMEEDFVEDYTCTLTK